MSISECSKLEKDLEDAFGRDVLQKITIEVTDILVKNKLDSTPNVLNDVFNYIRLSVLISKIWICYLEHKFLRNQIQTSRKDHLVIYF